MSEVRSTCICQQASWSSQVCKGSYSVCFLSSTLTFSYGSVKFIEGWKQKAINYSDKTKLLPLTFVLFRYFQRKYSVLVISSPLPWLYMKPSSFSLIIFSTCFEPPLVKASTSFPPFLKFASSYSGQSSSVLALAMTRSSTAPGLNSVFLFRQFPIPAVSSQ